MTKNAYVYILTNKHKNVIYTGVTNNLARRVQEHKNKTFKGFTKKYNVEHLVYFEVHKDIRDAIHREKIIKKKSRRGKVILVEKMNPKWSDLSLSII